jgi:hypothetical protein
MKIAMFPCAIAAVLVGHLAAWPGLRSAAALTPAAAASIGRTVSECRRSAATFGINVGL